MLNNKDGMTMQTRKLEPIFSGQKVDLRNRDAMLSFLDDHYKHNGVYAQNVKLRNLQLPENLRDIADKIVSDPDDPFWLEYYQTDTIGIIQRKVGFALKREDTPNISFEFRGRSNGQLVMQYVNGAYARDYMALDGADYDNDTAQLRAAVKDVLFFDRMVDEYRAAFMSYCKVGLLVADILHIDEPNNKPAKHPRMR